MQPSTPYKGALCIMPMDVYYCTCVTITVTCLRFHKNLLLERGKKSWKTKKKKLKKEKTQDIKHKIENSERKAHGKATVEIFAKNWDVWSEMMVGTLMPSEKLRVFFYEYVERQFCIFKFIILSNWKWYNFHFFILQLHHVTKYVPYTTQWARKCTQKYAHKILNIWIPTCFQ